MPGEFVIDFPKLRPKAWAPNGHLQTLANFVLRQQRSVRIQQKHLVHLKDGDRLVIHDDVAKSWITGDRVAILVHGLCGSHDSPYLRRIAIRLRRHGIRTIRVDMRGFGDSTLISRGHMHSGRSDDILEIVHKVNQLSPLSSISLIGFSLGANVILKFLAELPFENKTNVDSAIAVAPPIDLERCSANLRSYGNRFYDYYFVRRLTEMLQYRRRKVKNLVDNGLNPFPDRLLDLDDQFTAPVHGFTGARDYYKKCSSRSLINQICVPTIIVAAQDDPIIPFEIFDQRLFSPQVEFVSTKSGGHLGFLGNHPRDPDHFWLDWRICDWLTSLDN